MATALENVTEAKRLLAKATDLDDVLNIRDQAEAARVYCKAAGAGLEAQNLAAEVKIRAERKAGECLAAMDGKGGHGGSRKSSCTMKLEDLGITKTQSSRWQQEASVPEEQFEEWVADTKDTAKELTSAGLQRLGRTIKQQTATRPEPATLPADCHCVSDLSELDGEQYGTIYADPPWQYGNQSTRAATDNHYQTMTVDELCKMPIGDLAADAAHLHLWTTNGFLPDAFRVIDAWGFEYKSCFVWVKPQMGIGNYWRVSHEFLLLGVKGDAKRFNVHDKMSWLLSDRKKHSAKPEEVAAMIEEASPGPFLELFGRRPMRGWTVFGNQIESRLFT
jgi:N6-adenosine-specific RNA methylase IME4